MLILKDHKIGIFNVPKTGSKSIRVTLQKHGVEMTHKSTDETLAQHANLQDALNYFRANNLKYEQYDKFITVRNPWRRYYSLYNYLKAKHQELKSLGEQKNLKEIQQKAFERMESLLKNPIFEDNEAGLFKKVVTNAIRDKKMMYDFIYLPSGKIPKKTEILKFENIKEDFKKITTHISPDAHFELLHENIYKYEVASPKAVFDKESIEFIAKAEHQVIRDFGYEFDFF